jgi:hypothetical protein
MAYRTWSRACKTCRFWSELMAQSSSQGIQAMCLNFNSPHHQQWTLGEYCCPKWKSGHHSSIDDPECGNKAIELYAMEDAANDGS